MGGGDGISRGFLAPGLVTGTTTFLVLAIAASFTAVSFFAKETPNITKAESRKLGLVVVWVSAVCMWLIWACVYMHQMVPLIQPQHLEK
mmetsp:Transcript_37943/g.57213  ORF Transcript_37943/g.57213 Transcript_37943/m.57213 type:complete len:89 (-) Transcript_37943:136-402(-)|eukprot:CAMPEP_0206491702 /NCGR_PEP_ID=MMETSP0324_2-20121206/45306_1 /ASSEMBLY_ACC=CAM_ASM_000836 /TAXON_ID=2866 /ORGANISM="Crypthecodinium cohnii, Strain Seligo" /LENGTH=88 /DNA_ID=CAMNT_0053973249 /DNA_START=55 /DNA_END=321 /DNA_ORIENTATION=-